MPSILGFAAKKALQSTEERPVLQPKRCLNSKQGKAKCTACVELCPEHVIRLPEKGAADWDKCLNCGICAAACPAQAISFPTAQQRQLYQMLHDGQQTHVLGCERAEGETQSSVLCLAAYPWESIAALALVGRVELVRGDCAACPHAEKQPFYEQTLELVEGFLGTERFAARVTLRAPEEKGSGGVSRRELLAKMMPGKAKKTAQAQTMKCSTDGQILRAMLLETVKRAPDKTRSCNWRAPAVTEACSGCGICERMCPAQAIRIQEQEGQWYAVCTPVLCTDCGICELVCAESAIQGTEPVALQAEQFHKVYPLKAESCKGCGVAVRQGEELCARCKARKQKRGKAMA